MLAKSLELCVGALRVGHEHPPHFGLDGQRLAGCSLVSAKMADAPPAYKTYTIDLDLPPRQRWAHVVQDNLDALQDMAAAYNKALVEEFGALAPLANALAGLVSVPEVFREEMQGLADASQGRLTYALVAR